MRTVGAFIGSLFVFAILLVMGIFFGTLISIFIEASHGVDTPSPQNPLDFVQGHSTAALIGGAIGAVFGLVSMISINKRASDINWLKKYGTRIVATVTEIKEHRSSRTVSSGTNSTRTEWYSYYILMARWADPRTGTTHSFRSPRLNFYPKRFYPGCGIEVLVDMNNMRKYYMEM
ncbi:MAG: hypothetical protein ABI456_01355 [Ktedonobacteraceae bacterium]